VEGLDISFSTLKRDWNFAAWFLAIAANDHHHACPPARERHVDCCELGFRL
jgi:hypothetical protein